MTSESRDLNNIIASIEKLRLDIVAQRENAEKELDRTDERLEELDTVLETLRKRRERMKELLSKDKAAGASGG